MVEKPYPQTANIVSEKSNIGSLASKMSNIAVYGKDHPYAKISTESTIKSIETDDLVNYYNSYIRPNNGTLAIVGDFDIDKLTKKLENLLSKWSKKVGVDIEGPKERKNCWIVYFSHFLDEGGLYIFLVFSKVKFGNIIGQGI